MASKSSRISCSVYWFMYYSWPIWSTTDFWLGFPLNPVVQHQKITFNSQLLLLCTYWIYYVAGPLHEGCIIFLPHHLYIFGFFHDLAHLGRNLLRFWKAHDLRRDDWLHLIEVQAIEQVLKEVLSGLTILEVFQFRKAYIFEGLPNERHEFRVGNR